MNYYRVYELTRDNRILKPPEVVTCETDAEAIAAAGRISDGKPLEIWLHERRVCRLEPKH
jgi:hypothetical protein